MKLHRLLAILLCTLFMATLLCGCEIDSSTGGPVSTVSREEAEAAMAEINGS